MGGKDFFHTSRQTVIPPDEYDGGTGALLQHWPKTLNETIPKHDLALDEEGALIFITADGDVKAYWPPLYELLEP